MDTFTLPATGDNIGWIIILIIALVVVCAALAIGAYCLSKKRKKNAEGKGEELTSNIDETKEIQDDK